MNQISDLPTVCHSLILLVVLVSNKHSETQFQLFSRYFQHYVYLDQKLLESESFGNRELSEPAVFGQQCCRATRIPLFDWIIITIGKETLFGFSSGRLLRGFSFQKSARKMCNQALFMQMWTPGGFRQIIWCRIDLRQCFRFYTREKRNRSAEMVE